MRKEEILALFIALAIALLLYNDSNDSRMAGMTGNAVSNPVSFKVSAPEDLGIGDSVTFQGSRAASSVQPVPGVPGTVPRKIIVANAPPLYFAAAYPGSGQKSMRPVVIACLRNPENNIPINAEIRDSKGMVDARIALVDDGQHYDGRAGDGCYGAVLDGKLPSDVYSVSFVAAVIA